MTWEHRQIRTVDELITWLAQYPNDGKIEIGAAGRIIVRCNEQTLGYYRDGVATDVIHDDDAP